MSDQDYMFSLLKLRTTEVSIECLDKLRKNLYLEEDTLFSIGDVLLICGSHEAVTYIKVLPEKEIKKFVRVVVLPAIRRLTKNVSDENVIKLIGFISDYVYGSSFNNVDVQEISSEILKNFNSEENKELKNICFPLLSLFENVLSIEDNKLNCAINTIFSIINYENIPYDELTLQVESTLKAFPPIIKSYSSKSEDAFYETILKYKPNPILKALKFKRKDGKTFVFKWGSFKPEWGFGFNILEFDKLCDYSHLWAISFNFIFGSFWINLPKWLPNHHFDTDCQSGLRKWGFIYNGDGSYYFLVSWGKKNKYFDVPWTLTHIRTETLMKDGTWQKRPNWNATNPTREEFESKIATETYSVRYTLQRGVVQHRLATIKVIEREWRRSWLKYIPIFRFIKRTVDVEFSDEVGERSGSWKGGCIGTSLEMKQDELPRETLRRLMRENKF